MLQMTTPNVALMIGEPGDIVTLGYSTIQRTHSAADRFVPPARRSGNAAPGAER
jgi:hypothetical protein